MNDNVNNKEYETKNPLFHKIDSTIHNCDRNCQKIHFQKMDHLCVYDIKLTNIVNKVSVNLTISNKNMSLYELKKIKIA